MFSELRAIKVSESLYKTLLAVGATKEEARFYVCSINMGPSTLSSLARAMSWSRPKLYSIIRGLEKQGLLDVDNRKPYAHAFSVGSPMVLLELIQKKNSEAESLTNEMVDLLPALNSRLAACEKDLPLRYARGVDGVREFFRELYQSARGDLMFLGSMYNLITLLTPSSFIAMQKLRTSKNVYVKTLVTSKFDLLRLRKIRADGYRECRVLKNIEMFDASLHVSGEKIYIWDTKKPSAVIFKNREVAALIKSIFNRLWVLSELVFCALAIGLSINGLLSSGLLL